MPALHRAALIRARAVLLVLYARAEGNEGGHPPAYALISSGAQPVGEHTATPIQPYAAPATTTTGSGGGGNSAAFSTATIVGTVVGVTLLLVVGAFIAGSTQRADGALFSRTARAMRAAAGLAPAPPGLQQDVIDALESYTFGEERKPHPLGPDAMQDAQPDSTARANAPGPTVDGARTSSSVPNSGREGSAPAPAAVSSAQSLGSSGRTAQRSGSGGDDASIRSAGASGVRGLLRFAASLPASLPIIGTPVPSTPASSAPACAICLENYRAGELVRIVPCAAEHEFHALCIDPWLLAHASCPTCRHDLTPLRRTEVDELDRCEKGPEAPVSTADTTASGRSTSNRGGNSSSGSDNSAQGQSSGQHNQAPSTSESSARRGNRLLRAVWPRAGHASQ